MKFKLLLLVCISFFSVPMLGFSQVSFSNSTQISVLTCQPGNELYSLFGHTAIRLKDTANKLDVVFNYGTFDFNDPNFYTKFVQGRLPYFVSVDDYTNFIQLYQYEQRGITEQLIQLTNTAKQQVIQGLLVNLQPPNNSYAYHFLYDNCTTRVLQWVKKASPNFVANHSSIVPAETSFRNLLHVYLDKAHHDWEKLGIDLLLGLPCDKLVSVEHSMFLPELLQKGIATATPTLVAKEQVLLTYSSTVFSDAWYTKPLIVLGFISILLLVATQFGKPMLVTVLDAFLMAITAAIGCLLVFMWVGTSHDTCQNNFNVLWANPLLIGWFFGRSIRKKMAVLVSIILLITLATWWWLPQEMNIGFLPWVLLLLSRTWYYSTKK